jgi:hypothetical protein
MFINNSLAWQLDFTPVILPPPEVLVLGEISNTLHDDASPHVLKGI